MRTNKILGVLTLGAFLSLGMTACQKMDRPDMVIIEDPTPPAYEPLKTFLAFENNANDNGENKLTATASNISYVAGVSGQAMKVGDNGYLAFTKGDSVKYPNEFVGVPLDTLKNLGSFTVAFWMNAAGPVQGGAQGIFSIANKKEFWGNLDLFLENNVNVDEAFLKVHLLNANVTTGGEQWIEVKIPGVLNKWTHLAVTYNAATSKLNIYANGQPTAIADKVLNGGQYGAIKYSDVSGMVLGSHSFLVAPTLANHGAEPWAKSLNGSLDQFRLYNKALNSSEIAALYTSKQ